MRGTEKASRQEYRELCERRKKEENLRWKKKAEGVRREGGLGDSEQRKEEREENK